MTNIAALPQLQASSIKVVTNADWRDPLQFVWGPNTPNAGQPLDITGISFHAQLRPTIDDPSVLLDMSTGNGLLVTNNALGTLQFAVPVNAPAGGPSYCMSILDVPTAVLDIIATGDGQVRNLFQVAGPANVIISSGITKS